MAHQNVVDIGFDVEAVSAEKKQILDLFVDLFGQLKQYDGTKFNPLGAGGFAELKKAMTDGAAAMDGYRAKVDETNKVITTQAEKQAKAKKATDDMTESEKIHQATLQTIISTKAKLSEAETNASSDKAIELNRLKAVTAEVNLNAKAYLSNIGSLNEARASNALLTAERNKLNLSTTEGQAKLQSLNAAIEKNDEFIRTNSTLLEKQKINIGNYNGAVSILESGLNGISSKLSQFAAAGDLTSEAVQKLTLEQQILKVLLDKQAAGFTSVTQEIRATKNALDTLAVAGLENTETFNRLNSTYETSKSKLAELHNQQKILSDQNPAIAALTATARGLGGAYALGAGASALFADGNEKVEKELNKLVAIMTFLQGLEEAVRAVRERGAVVTALEATATKALAAAKQIEVTIFGTSETVIKGETIAKAVNTEVTEANIVASEGDAGAKVVSAGASEGLAGANVLATESTVALRTALISTGIGAIIIGVIYAITKLVGAISDWANADEKAEEKNKALAESSKELLDISEKLNDAFEEGSRKKVDALEKENDKVKAAGQNQFIQLANERKIAEQRQQNAKETLAFLDVEGGALDAVGERRTNALLKVEGIESQIRTAKANDDKKEVERLEKKKESANAEFNVLDLQYSKGLAATKDYNDQTAKIEENSIQQAKAAAELLAKISADAAQRRFENVKNANDRILALETSTERERLVAVKSNYSAEAALAGAQIEAIKKLEADKIITEQDAGNQIATIRNTLNLKYKASIDEGVKIRTDGRNRLLTAENTISKNNNESDASLQDAITKDLQHELDERLIALKQNISDKTKVIVDDYNLQIALGKDLNGKTKYTAEELAAIESTKNKALVELTAGTQKEIYDITISYGDKQLKAVEDRNKAIDSANKVTTDYNAQTDSLNTALINQSISYRKYVAEKTNLDRKYNIDRDRAEIADDEKRLENVRDLEIKKLNIQEFFAQKALDAAKAGGNQDEIAKAQAKVDALHVIQTKAAGEEVALVDKTNKDKQKLNADTVAATIKGEEIIKERTKQLEEQTFTLAQTLVDASYENRINKIQHLIDIQDQQSASEIAAIQRSTIAQRDQAAEIIILEAQQRARDTQARIEIRQEKIKEAKFDRDISVAKAIWSTAQAVMKDTADVPWPLSLAVAAIDIALGAVQVATILARPIPAYAEGVESHPGGMALVGEGKYKERVSVPGRDPFIVDRAMLLNLPADTSVMPLSPENMIYDLGGTAMSRGAAMAASWPDPSKNDWEIAKWSASRFEKAIKKSQRKIQNTINVYVDNDWGNYVQTKITGKR